MANDLIFEIGTEEIPAGFVPRSLEFLEGYFKKGLDSARLTYKALRPLGTPRRLAVIVEGLAGAQPDATIEVRGPQARAAFGADGSPTGALSGFAKAQGVDVSEIKTVKTDKGEYVYVIKSVKGKKTEEILPELLFGALNEDFFPKSMRWGAHDISFARPVHWLLAVYGGKTVDVQWGHLRSSDVTYGHRFLSAPKEDNASPRPMPVRITDASTYASALKDAFVTIDPEARKAAILDGLETEARKAGGRLVPDQGLLDEVTNLVEHPVVVMGSFEKEFLALPDCVVMNAMREHQRYFSLVDKDGKLLPRFLTVANTRAIDMGVVAKGNERVLRARLNDAKFYFEKDVKRRLVDRVGDLKGVVFQAKLGTSYEKVERFAWLALHIGHLLGFSASMDARETPSDFTTDNYNPASLDRKKASPEIYNKLVVGRAAMLAKADLTSGMVGEFPKLQGVMGSIYAARDNEAPEVCRAIVEHYRPAASGGELPAETAGAIVSVSDKLDTIAGCFGVGLIPTGAQDPYALRRQALGVIAIILENGWRAPLDALVDKALTLLSARLERDATEAKGSVMEFFRERLKQMLLSQSVPFDAIDAVYSAPSPSFDIVDTVARIKALDGFKAHPSAPALTIAFKRVSNILKGVEPGGREPSKALFSEPAEKALNDVRVRLSPVIEGYRAKGDYASALKELASIKEVIDSFFDKVMVMAEDEGVRANRLALLDSVRELYRSIADLSKLSI